MSQRYSSASQMWDIVKPARQGCSSRRVAIREARAGAANSKCCSSILPTTLLHRIELDTDVPNLQDEPEHAKPVPGQLPTSPPAISSYTSTCDKARTRLAWVQSAFNHHFSNRVFCLYSFCHASGPSDGRTSSTRST